MALTGKSHCISSLSAFIAALLDGNCNRAALRRHTLPQAHGLSAELGAAGQRLCPVWTWPVVKWMAAGREMRKEGYGAFKTWVPTCSN